MITYLLFNFMTDEFPDVCIEYLNDTCISYGLSNYSKCNDLSVGLTLLSDEKILHNNYLNNAIDVFIVFFVTSTSLLFSILIVSICVYEKMINQFVENYNAHREYYEYDTYFFEYLDEFNELNNVKLDDIYLNSLQYKYIKQKTPKGDVLMNYNHSNSSFDYYCKKSNSIDFLYLDVVSRIYVVNYNCKNVYVDNYDNFELIKTYYANLTSAISSFDELKEKNIFYNKINKNNHTKQSIDYVSNKYKYRGTFEDFNTYCKNNDYKIDTQNFLENDIFVLEKTSTMEIITEIKDETMDSNNITFKTFKNRLAVSSQK